MIEDDKDNINKEGDAQVDQNQPEDVNSPDETNNEGSTTPEKENNEINQSEGEASSVV